MWRDEELDPMQNSPDEPEYWSLHWYVERSLVTEAEIMESWDSWVAWC